MADVVFGQNSGGAAFGNPNITKQGRAASATQATGGFAGGGRGTVNPAVVDPNKPPPKANSAPKPTSTTSVGTGLIAALNNYQQQQVKLKRYNVADIYEIK